MKKLVEVPILQVVQLCGIWVKHNSGSTELRARCPFCGGWKGRPTSSINTVKNVFFCHRCHEGHNSLTLYSKLTGASTKQAYRELTQTLDNAA